MATFKTSSMILGEIAAKLSGRPFHPDGFDDEGDALEIIKENIGSGGGGEGVSGEMGYIGVTPYFAEIEGLYYYYDFEQGMWFSVETEEAFDLESVDPMTQITFFDTSSDTVEALQSALDRKVHACQVWLNEQLDWDGYVLLDQEYDGYSNYVIASHKDKHILGYYECIIVEDPMVSSEKAVSLCFVPNYMFADSESQSELSYYFDTDEGMLYEEGSNRQIVYSQEGPEVIEYIMSHPNKIKLIHSLYPNGNRVAVGACSKYQPGEDVDSYQILFPEDFSYRPDDHEFEQYTTIVELVMDSDRDAIGCNLVVTGRVSYETDFE